MRFVPQSPRFLFQSLPLNIVILGTLYYQLSWGNYTGKVTAMAMLITSATFSNQGEVASGTGMKKVSFQLVHDGA